MKKIFIVAMLTIILVGCSKNEENKIENNEEENKPQDNLDSLEKPLLLVSNNGVAAWDFNAKATGYKYKINDGNEQFTKETSIKLNDGDKICVSAIGDGKNYSNSEYSVNKTYTKDNSIMANSLSVTEALNSNDKIIYIKGSIMNDVNSNTGELILEDHMGNNIKVLDLYKGNIDVNYNNDTWNSVGAISYKDSKLNLKKGDYLCLYGQIDSNKCIDNALVIKSVNVLELSGIDLKMMNYVDSLITSTEGSIPSWNKESFKGKWNYIDGVFLNSIVNLCNNLEEENPLLADKYKSFFINYINYYINEDGKFINIKDLNQSGYKSGELDSVCESKILFDAFNYTGDSRYLNAIKTTYNELNCLKIVEGTNNFSHKDIYNDQIWLDGFYMYAPFYIRYALAMENNEDVNNLINQYKNARKLMFDEEKKLYHHGYDGTKSIFWAMKNGCSKSFWLRSMGWYIVSIADVLDYIYEGENKEYLKDLLKEALDGVLLYQDNNSKMFYQVVDYGNNSASVSSKYLSALKNKAYLNKNGKYDEYTNINNYLESSGSSMIAYALIKGANKNYIDKAYLNKGIEAFEGVYNHSFDDTKNELNNICITAGLGPEGKDYRDGTVEYYLAEPVGSNDAKGVGPFIMAYLQYKNR